VPAKPERRTAEIREAVSTSEGKTLADGAWSDKMTKLESRGVG